MRAADGHTTNLPDDPAALRALLAADLATWGRLIRESGIRVE